MDSLLIRWKKRNRHGGIIPKQKMSDAKKLKESIEKLELEKNDDEFLKNLGNDIAEIDLSGETTKIRKRISTLLKAESSNEDYYSQSEGIKTEKISEKSIQELLSNFDSDQYSVEVCPPKELEAKFRRRRSRRKCKASFVPILPIDAEEIKEEPDYESDQDIEEVYEHGEEEKDKNVGYMHFDHLEPIMEMQSFDERGSYSCILSKTPSLDYHDAELYEFKELTSSKALINRVPYTFLKNTSKALKCSIRNLRRKSKSAPKIPKFKRTKAAIILKKRSFRNR
ncbi:unnamed protein product [Moneuplotes crassus]|uniref:Uncharacterized protein n=1 Tax=Euplotes crassus TaxID=5936 RepID=A0AAD1X7P6_EUPCR|nr:unnamed protein product [Moneuplotes crassus]